LVNVVGRGTAVVDVVVVAGTVVSGTVEPTVEVGDCATVVVVDCGTVDATVGARGSSAIAGFASTLLSATTGLDVVPTSVDT
jgi:hypothetical protein